MSKSEITMEITKEIGNVGNKLKLNMISWNGADPKYDLRNWYTDKDGNEKYAKGITFTREEMVALRDLLNGIED